MFNEILKCRHAAPPGSYAASVTYLSKNVGPAFCEAPSRSTLLRVMGAAEQFQSK